MRPFDHAWRLLKQYDNFPLDDEGYGELGPGEHMGLDPNNPNSQPWFPQPMPGPPQPSNYSQPPMPKTPQYPDQHDDPRRSQGQEPTDKMPFPSQSEVASGKAKGEKTEHDPEMTHPYLASLPPKPRQGQEPEPLSKPWRPHPSERWDEGGVDRRQQRRYDYR